MEKSSHPNQLFPGHPISCEGYQDTFKCVPQTATITVSNTQLESDSCLLHLHICQILCLESRKRPSVEAVGFQGGSWELSHTLKSDGLSGKK